MTKPEEEKDVTWIDFNKIKARFHKNENEKGEKTKSETNKRREDPQKSASQEAKTEQQEKTSESTKEKEISLDFKKISNFFSKNKVIIPAILLIIAIFFAAFFRLYPSHLPITDDWAKSSVYSFYQQQIRNEVQRQYPNLPEANRETLVTQQFEEFKKTNQARLDSDIAQTSKQFKSRLQYTYTTKSGSQVEYTYLLDIDSYLWYGYGKNYLQCGHPGCDLHSDGKYYTYRNGREGMESGFIWWDLFGAFLYKFLKIFVDIPLMQAYMLLPLVAICLSVIPAFFIAKRFSGNMGGFFAGMFIALNTAIMARTNGTSDNDAANVLFPLLIMWFFIEAYYAKNWIRVTICSILGAISFLVYMRVWDIVHIIDFLIIAVVGWASLIIIYNIFIKKKSISQTYPIIKLRLLKAGFFLLITFAIIVIYTKSFDIFTYLISFIIDFISMKQVGVVSIWPNVLTTVAEFNVTPLASIVSQMGGSLFWIFAILGLILIIVKKDEKHEEHIMFILLLLVWFFATLYSFTKGVRFALLMAPIFAIAFGIGVGLSYTYIHSWLSNNLSLNKILTTILLVFIFSLLLVQPLKAANSLAKSEIPIYNDAWDNTLTKIREDAPDKIGYITTWWDFGHFFVAMGSRVTFDGGGQGERIHWVGKSLLTDNEDLSVGLIRMMNCAQEKAPHVIENYVNNNTILAVDILNEIVQLNKEEARSRLEEKGFTNTQINEILAVTYCDNLFPQYFIASEDMVGKSGVWAHFGSWDFRRATMWQTVHDLDQVSGTQYLIKEFNMTEEQASNTYYEITTTPADQWISPWPSYMSGETACQKQNEVLLYCQAANIPLIINLTTMDVNIPLQNGQSMKPSSIVYIEGLNTTEKFFTGQSTGFSIILIPNGEEYTVVVSAPTLANSMFTRMFFYKGHGLVHFKPLTVEQEISGGMIYTYRVDWNSTEAYNAYPEYVLKQLNQTKTQTASTTSTTTTEGTTTTTIKESNWPPKKKNIT